MGRKRKVSEVLYKALLALRESQKGVWRKGIGESSEEGRQKPDQR